MNFILLNSFGSQTNIPNSHLINISYSASKISPKMLCNEVVAFTWQNTILHYLSAQDLRKLKFIYAINLTLLGLHTEKKSKGMYINELRTYFLESYYSCYIYVYMYTYKPGIILIYARSWITLTNFINHYKSAVLNYAFEKLSD